MEQLIILAQKAAIHWNNRNKCIRDGHKYSTVEYEVGYSNCLHELFLKASQIEFIPINNFEKYLKKWIELKKLLNDSYFFDKLKYKHELIIYESKMIYYVPFPQNNDE